MKRIGLALPMAALCVLFAATAFAQQVVPATVVEASTLQSWSVLLGLLVGTWYHALRDDVSLFPTLPATWRNIIVAVMGVLAGALDFKTNGGHVMQALLSGFATALPSLILMVIGVLSGGGGSGSSGGISAKAPKDGSPKSTVRPPAPYATKMIGAAALACALVLPGCAGTIHDTKVVVRTVADEVVADAEQASAWVGVAHSATSLFFMIHPDAATQAKVEQIFADVNAGIAFAIDMAQGTDAATTLDYNAAFAKFREAYADLTKILADLGVTVPDFGGRKMSVARRGGGAYLLKAPRAAFAKETK